MKIFLLQFNGIQTKQIPLPGGPFLLGNHVVGAFAFEFPTFVKLLKDDSHSTAIHFHLRATTFGQKSGWQTGAGNRPPKKFRSLSTPQKQQQEQQPQLQPP